METDLARLPTARARAGLGAVVAVAALALLTVILRVWPWTLTLTSVALLYLIPVVAAAAIGGLWLGLATAAAAELVLNWFFVPPFHTLQVDRGDNVVALAIYVLVAVAVAVAVDLAARQRAAAARSGVEARLLARISAEPVTSGQALRNLLGHVQEAFGMTSVALVETDTHGATRVVEAVGPPITGTPTFEVPAADRLHLVTQGPETFAADQRLLGQLAVAAARTLDASRQAAQAEALAEVDRVRTAILAAVGHDLRTPLASIKAAASSLRAPDVQFSDADRAELLATVEESADRLDDLVENLLAMSRLQAGVLSVQVRPVALDEVVSRALMHTPPYSDLRVDVGDDLPLIDADPGLLERVVANLVSNAVKAAAGRSVLVRAVASNGRIDLEVIDHGRGIDAGDRERVFAPFQRLDDRSADGGLGLGLAISRGFATAMGASVVPTETIGGGLTMTVSLPLAPYEGPGAAR
jgi:two-component system sensor histidine kinase KdpD